jgi:hypothetical protein
MQPDAVYTVSINSAQDLAGNKVADGTTAQVKAWTVVPGFITFQTYNTPVSGTTVDLLTSSPNYPDNPRETFYITSFNTRAAYPDDSHEQFGGRLYGLFTPPTSGNWIFHLRSDDSSELYLNPTGSGAGGKVLIAAETGCCGQFSKIASPPQALTAGQQYYLEAIYKEGGGGDYCQVAVRLDTDPTNPDTLSPIPSSMLSTLIDPAGISLAITEQPTDQVGVISTPGTVLIAEDFTGGNGGFTVTNTGATPPADGPWAFDAPNSQWVTQGAIPDCGTPWNTLLHSPTYTLTESGSLSLTLNHRYAFEGQLWDGGQIRISVNGAPFVAVTNFLLNGYAVGALIGNHMLIGQAGFNGESPGYGAGGLITSVAETGPYNAGDQIVIQFAAALDECSTGTRPNWVIDSLIVNEGIRPLYAEDFTANDGTFTVVNTNNPVGPWVYNAARGTWSAAGGEGICASLLSSPNITVSKDGYVKLTFHHRYNFEDGATLWDGGQIRVSVNGGPYALVPPENFSTNGYAEGLFVGNGFIKGLPGFNGQSADYTNSFIKSVAGLGAFQVGDMLSVQFAGSWDDSFIQPPSPNWELDMLSLDDGIALPVTFTVVVDATVPGATTTPIAYQWQVDRGTGFEDIIGANKSSLTFFVREEDDGTWYRCVVSVPGASVTSEAALLTIGGAARPTVSVTRGDGTVTIEWTSGTLESAPTVLGPWTEVTGATSPYTVPATGAGMFYRARQ